jgi:hypothetical protein
VSNSNPYCYPLSSGTALNHDGAAHGRLRSDLYEYLARRSVFAGRGALASSRDFSASAHGILVLIEKVSCRKVSLRRILQQRNRGRERGGSRDGMSGTAELPLPATKNGHSHTGGGGGVVTLNLPSASRLLKAASCRELPERACDHGRSIGQACLCSPTVIRAARVRAELRNVLAVDQRLLAVALGHAKATCEAARQSMRAFSRGSAMEISNRAVHTYLRAYKKC